MMYAWLWRVNMLFIAFGSWWKSYAVVCYVFYFTSFLHFADLIVLRCKPVWKCKKIFLSAGFIWWIYQYLYKRSTMPMIWIWATQGTVMVVSFLPVKSRKRLAHDTLNVFASRADLVYDTTGHKMAAFQSCFQDFNTLIFKREKTGQEMEWKTVGCIYFIPFLLIGPMMLLQFRFFLKKDCWT